jgi:hypothetical protein
VLILALALFGMSGGPLTYIVARRRRRS